MAIVAGSLLRFSLLWLSSDRYSHAISIAQNIKAHDAPIKAIGLLTRPDGVKIITGSSDKHIKVWNASTWANEGGFDTNGEVQHIEIIENFLFWSMDVILQDGLPDPVGQVHMINVNDQQRVWCQVILSPLILCKV